MHQSLDLLLQTALHVQAAKVEHVLAPVILVVRGLREDIGEDIGPAAGTWVHIVHIAQEPMDAVDHPPHLLLR